MSPEAILVQLRTLVSYAVNNGLFRIYNECDPTLGKIIRNIKIYIKTSPILSIASRFGDNYIAAADVDACRHLPEMPQEVLEGKIAAIPSATSDIRSLMSHLAQIMVETNEYQRTIPLVSVAQVFRKHICVCDIPEDEIQEESQNLRTGDLKTIIRESCSQVSRSARQRYVAKGKVSAHLYDCYFSSIEKYLERLMAGTDGDPDSLYSVLVEFHPGLSKAEYRQYHKATLEYLARKCKKTCAGMMKRI
ncbi:MAG: hypothetical protein NTU47_00060 [Ignavibacteriales bacterium]|nr:hypothetical protein [Ignavibacteriales bacterium]